MNGLEASSSGDRSAPRAKLVFSRGSVLYKKGLHHVAYTLASAVDNGPSDSVAAAWINTSLLRRSVLPRLEVMEDRRLLSTFMVRNLNDSGAYSLRAGIQSGDATIAFAPGLHGSIALKSELSIGASVTIEARGPTRCRSAATTPAVSSRSRRARRGHLRPEDHRWQRRRRQRGRFLSTRAPTWTSTTSS